MRISLILAALLLLGATLAFAEADVGTTAASAAATQSPPTPPAAAVGATAPICLPAQIRLHPQHKGVPMRLGEWLNLVLSGQCAVDVATQLAQSGAAPGANGKASGITLLLNDVQMQDVPMVLAHGDDRGQSLLSFRLRRNADDSANLASWNSFLRNNESCCAHAFNLKEMQVTIALAIGNRPAAALGDAQSFQFRVEDREVVAWTFWVLFVVFFTGFVLCVRSPTLLRDTPGGSYSLAKSQMAFWGLIVALCFAGVWFVIGSMEQIPNEVLILLGISAATGWLSPYAGASSVTNAMSALSVQQQQAQTAADANTAAGKIAVPASKTANESDAEAASANAVHAAKMQAISADMLRTSARDHLRKAENFLRDICSDGEGVCVHRVQAVAWTVILGVVFVCEVTTVISMPVFSTNLLLLLGISNGTYLTLKTKEQP